MANCVAFQSKLSSIMEMLAKAAVVEISKLWEDGFTLVQVELRRREKEIETLNRKLMLMENERVTVRSQSRTTNLSSTASSNRDPQGQVLPPAGDGLIIDKVQTLCSDHSVKEKGDTSVHHRTPPPSQTEEKQCEQLKSEHLETDSRDENNEDLIVKLEDEDDVQIVEQGVDSDHHGAGCLEVKLNLQPAEVMEEQESQQWSLVSVGDSDTADDSDCFFEPKQLSQNMDSEILLIQNALDIFDNSAEASYSERFVRDNRQGTSSKSRAPVPSSEPRPSNTNQFVAASQSQGSFFGRKHTPKEASS
ncbi:uncharacterized protein V6R79_022450 [Siganus canaliculatus]